MLTREERFAPIDDSLRTVAGLVQRSENTLARAIWEFLQHGACYAEPLPSAPGRLELQECGWIFPDYGARRRHPVRLSLLAESERGHFGEVWDTLIGGHGVAIFFPLANMIALRAERAETPPCIGATVLHEAGHALRATQRREAGAPPPAPRSPENLREEVEMHTLQGALWREQSPTRYDTALQKGLYWAQRYIRKYRDKPGERFIGLPHYVEELEVVLGRAPSDQARADRKLHFDILVNFALADASRRSPREVETLKANMIYAVYEFVGFTGVLGEPR